MIDIYVQRTRAKACADAPITSGSVGLVARFRFSEEWEELNKIAIFETDNYKEPIEIPEAGEVTVPDSVLVYPWTQLRVGVRGESEDGHVVIPTVYADCGTISLGANTTPVGTPPTPSQAEYLQAQIDELRESGIGGGITEETDPTVPAWAKVPEKPSYTAEEVGALPVGTEIPVVPSKVSAFENDKGYLTEQNLSGYAKSEDIPTKPSDIGAQPAGNYATKDEIPTTLPNPHKLTFSGAVNAEYDGSEAVEVVIPQGGGGGGAVASVNGQTGAVVLDAADVGALPLSGGTMTGELRVNGGDAAGSSKIVLEGNGMITDSGTSTLLGLWQGKTYYVGHSKYATVMRGSASRPTYNGNDLALYSDITVNSGGGSSNGAGVWEHICDITTTEQVDAGIVVTENSEGVPLSELKYNEIWVMAKMVGVDTNTNNWWSCRCTAHQTEVGGQTYNGTFSGAVSGGTTGTKYVSYYFFIRGGKAYWTDCAKIDPYDVGGGDQAWNNHYLDKYAFDYFTSVTMWADSARIIGADTEVRILGRRA